ncbi:MAG TPA: hypothetical protein VGV67_02495 [Solirubrobacteraceae bacterium]|nr:hypothetical protein [Solirubrobacteraceae bacterium]
MTTFTSDIRLTTTAADDWRELDHRRGDGLVVTLLWSRSRDHLKVAVTDWREGRTFDFDVPGRDALHAFRHPFAYATAL